MKHAHVRLVFFNLCVSDLQSGHLNVKAECPFGCPGAVYDGEPEKKSVLVLNTQITNTSKLPVMIKFDGKL